MTVYIGVDLHKTQFTVHVRIGDKVEDLSEIKQYPTTQAGYTEFTGGLEYTEPDSPEHLLDYTHLNEYNNTPYRKSNVWCDVLEYQAKSSKSSIEEVTGENAQLLANQGFVVIAAWKNNERKDQLAHPHYTTVAPIEIPYKSEKGVLVAHIGTTSEICYEKLVAFKGKSPVRFFYNRNQKFREDYTAGGAGSIESLEEKDGKEE